MKNYDNQNLIDISLKNINNKELAIKIGQNIFPIKIKNNYSKEINFYKCQYVNISGVVIEKPNIISSSSYYGNGYESTIAFDGSSVQYNHGWFSVAGDSTPWIKGEYDNNKIINQYSFDSVYDSKNQVISDWRFQASNDDQIWTDLDIRNSYSLRQGNSHFQTFIENNNSYKFYRLYFENTNGYSYIGAQNIKFCYYNNDNRLYWNGKKAQLQEEKYVFQENTTEIPYNNIIPQIGKIYSEDLLIEIKTIKTDFPIDYCFYNCLSSLGKFEKYGSGSQIIYDNQLNINVFELSNSQSYFKYQADYLNLPYGKTDRTISFWCKKDQNSQNGFCLGYGSLYYEFAGCFLFKFYQNKPVISSFDSDFISNNTIDNNWHHYTLILKNKNTIKLYIDGIQDFQKTYNSINTNPGYIFIGDCYQYYQSALTKFSSLRIYNRILSNEQINILSNEFSI